MIFARKVWHLLVAIKDGLALLFLLAFFLLLYGALTTRPSIGAVRDGALLLRLDGALVEEPQAADPLAQLLSSQVPVSEYRTRDIVDALHSAAKDDRIKAVVLDLAMFTGGGLVNLQEVGEALDGVRAAKKPVLAHAIAYSDDSLLLAAHSSEVWVHPMGGAFIMGPGGNRLYFGKLLERFKITAHVFKVGTFKSAVEPYFLDHQSDPAKENATALYGALWQAWQANVKAARPKANIAMATTDPAAWLRASGGDPVKAALAAGLVDKVGTSAQFGARVAALAGEDPLDTRPGAYAHTSLRTWLAANPQQGKGRAIGVITVAGEIVDGDAGPGTAGGSRIAGLLDDALEQDLAALVVRVDSPGGSILASETIRNAIQRHKAKGIPVVVSMANMAASGGYWVSTPANRIFAEPATITGSIGVFAVIPSFEGALAEYGVHSDGVQTTPISGQPDIFAGFSPAVKDMLQANVEHSYGKFLGLVAQSRGKSVEQVDAIAQGRVWDGGAARQQGLVDQFGGLDDALAAAAGLAKLGKDDWHAEYLGSDADPYAGLLARMQPDEDSAPAASARDWFGTFAAQQAQMGQRALAQAGHMLSVQSTQAFCLECPPAPVATPLDRERAGLLARMARSLGLI